MFLKLFFLQFKLETALLSCHHYPAPSGKKCPGASAIYGTLPALRAGVSECLWHPGLCLPHFSAHTPYRSEQSNIFPFSFLLPWEEMTVCTWCVESLNSVFLTPLSVWLTFFYFKFLYMTSVCYHAFQINFSLGFTWLLVSSSKQSQCKMTERSRARSMGLGLGKSGFSCQKLRIRCMTFN